MDPFCHTSSIEVNVPAKAALDYMSDGIRQGEWTFGSWDRRHVRENLFVGTSLFDGMETYVRITVDEAYMIVHYHLGDDTENMVPRNMARIMPGSMIGKDDSLCIVSLISWRHAFMSDDRWHQLCLSHEAQMYIIKNRLEGIFVKSGSGKKELNNKGF